MSNYWAKFIKIDNDIFRLDTRIYLKGTNNPSLNDKCIGAVVGKNPGSATYYGNIDNNLTKINLKGDNLLPCVKNIFLKAYKEANKPISPNIYIQVLNLMYICDKDLDNAIKRISKIKNPIQCDVEKKSFDFIWYVWGNEIKELNEFKGRFNGVNAKKHFFYHTHEEKIFECVPNVKDPARHTQGLSHNLIVPFISTII